MPNSIKLAILMDDVFSINPIKDSSFAMMLAAQRRGYSIYCFDSHQMSWHKEGISAQLIQVKLTDNSENFVSAVKTEIMMLKEVDAILMRKDPPFDMNYIYASYFLEQLEKEGVLVVNKPQSLRDFNEKLSIMQFTNCITNTLVSSEIQALKDFLHEHQEIVIKPLDGMGGVDIFKLSITDSTNMIEERINYLTHSATTPIMAQKFLAKITQGDKRILVIGGKPIDYALARIPKKGSFKGNLAQGAQGIAQPLSKRDYWLCEQIAPTLINKGLTFVGLDVIGDHITEINVTSPTGIRELDKQCGLDIAGVLFDFIEQEMK